MRSTQHSPSPSNRYNPIHVKFILFGLMLQSVLDLIDEGMFNVAVPSIQETYGLPVEVLSLIVAVRYLARIGLLPIYGFVGDRFGQKRTFIVSLSLFILGAFISYFSPSVLWLVIGRAFQGMSGGIIPISMAIVSDLFSSEKRGQMLGYLNAAAPLGVILGSPVGGAIIEAFGWKAIFILSGIGSVICFVIIARYLKRRSDPRDHPSSADWIGASYLFTLTTAFLFATSTSSVFPFGSAANLVFWAVFGLSLALLLRNMRSKPNPFISTAVVRNRQLIMPSLTVTFRMFGLGGTVFLLVLYLTNVLGKSPGTTGFFMVAHSIPIFLFVPVGGYLADRWNNRNAAVLGMLIQTFGMLLLSLVNPRGNDLVLLPGMFVAGLGAGISLTPCTKGAVTSLGDENVGLAAGLFNMIRFVGVAASAPLLGLILAAGFERAGGIDTSPEPYQFGFWILTACVFFGTLIALLIPTPLVSGNEEGS